MGNLFLVAIPVGIGMALASTFGTGYIPVEYHPPLFWLGIGLIVFGSVAWLILNSTQKKGPIPKYRQWDIANAYTLDQVAFLMEDQEPQGEVQYNRAAQKQFKKLERALSAGILKTPTDSVRNAVENAVKIAGKQSITANPEWTVYRSDLLEYVAQVGLKPPFLFPEERNKSVLRKAFERNDKFIAIALAVLSALLAIYMWNRSEVPGVRVSQIGEAYWAPLTSEQEADLTEALLKVNRGKMQIGCNYGECRALARDFYDLFTRLGWTVNKPQGQGLDAFVEGISLSPRTKETEQISEAIKAVTSYKVLLEGDAVADDDVAISLNVGTKPLDVAQ